MSALPNWLLPTDPLVQEKTDSVTQAGEQKLKSLLVKDASFLPPASEPVWNPLQIPSQGLPGAPVASLQQPPGTTLQGTPEQAPQSPKFDPYTDFKEPQPLPKGMTAIDADSLIYQGQSYRLASGAPGSTYDAAEVPHGEGKNRYEKNPKALERHQQAYTELYGRTPSKEDLYRFGEYQKQKFQELLNQEQPYIQVVGTEEGEGKRPLIKLVNKQGQDITSSLTGMANNLAFSSPYNQGHVPSPLYDPNYLDKLLLRPGKTWSQYVTDPAISAVTGTGNLITNTFLETASLLGGPAVAAVINDKLHLPNILTIDPRYGRSQGSIAKEQLANKEANLYTEYEKQNRARLQKEYENIPYGKDVAEVLVQSNAIINSIKNAIDRPDTTLVSLMNSTLPSVGIMAISAYMSGIRAAVSLADQFGLSYLTSSVGKQQVAQIATRTGLTTEVIVEATSTSQQQRQKTLEMSFNKLSKEVPQFDSLVAGGMSKEDARALLANEGAIYAGSLMAGLTFITNKATGAAESISTLFLPKALKESATKVPTRTGLWGQAAKTAVEAPFKESGQELLQSGGEPVIYNLIDALQQNKPITPEVMQGSGWAGGQGAIQAFGGTGILSTPGPVARAGISQLKGQYTYKENPITYTQDKYEERESKMNPQLLTALTHVGRPITITSGVRLATDPVEAKKDKPGYHVSGDAVDIDMSKFSPQERKQLVLRLYQNGVNRFGTYDEFPDMLHVDMGVTAGKDFYPMHNRTASQLEKAPKWFKETIAEIQGSIGKGEKKLILGRQIPTGSAWAQQYIPNTLAAQTLNTHISNASRELGLPPEAEAYLRATVEVESSWGQNLQNPNSSAKGPWQFTKDTGRSYGLSEEDVMDPEKSTYAAAKHLKDAYDIQKQNNPNLPDGLLWYRAAISLHQGKNSKWKTYEDLSEEGKAHADKLAKFVNKYVPTQLKRGSTTTPQQTPIANQTRQTYVEAAPTEEQVTDYKSRAKALIDTDDQKTIEEQFKKFTSKNTTEITRADVAENSSLIEAFEDSLINKYQQDIQSQVDEAVAAGQPKPNLTELLPKPEIATLLQQGFDWIEQARAKAAEAEQFLVHKEATQFSSPEGAPTSEDIQYFTEAALQGNLKEEDKNNLVKRVDEDIATALNQAFEFGSAFDTIRVPEVAVQKLVSSSNPNYRPLQEHRDAFLKQIEAKSVSKSLAEVKKLISFINSQEKKIEAGQHDPELMDQIKQEQHALKRAAGAMIQYYNNLHKRGEFQTVSDTGTASGPTDWTLYSNPEGTHFTLTQSSDKAKLRAFQDIAQNKKWGEIDYNINNFNPVKLENWTKAKISKSTKATITTKSKVPQKEQTKLETPNTPTSGSKIAWKELPNDLNEEQNAWHKKFTLNYQMVPTFIDEALKEAEKISGTTILRIGNTNPREDYVVLAHLVEDTQEFQGRTYVYGHATGEVNTPSWKFLNRGPVLETVYNTVPENVTEAYVVACDDRTPRNFAALEHVLVKIPPSGSETEIPVTGNFKEIIKQYEELNADINNWLTINPHPNAIKDYKVGARVLRNKLNNKISYTDAVARNPNPENKASIANNIARAKQLLTEMKALRQQIIDRIKNITTDTSKEDPVFKDQVKIYKAHKTRVDNWPAKIAQWIKEDHSMAEELAIRTNGITYAQYNKDLEKYFTDALNTIKNPDQLAEAKVILDELPNLSKKIEDTRKVIQDKINSRVFPGSGTETTPSAPQTPAELTIPEFKLTSPPSEFELTPPGPYKEEVKPLDFSKQFSFNFNEKQLEFDFTSPSIAEPISLNIRKGVAELYTAIPQLANIGTQEQYSQYLDTVFPESQVKDIVYHGSSVQFDEFNIHERGYNAASEEQADVYFAFFFAEDPLTAEWYMFQGRQKDIRTIWGFLEETFNIATKFGHNKYSYFQDSLESFIEENPQYTFIYKELTSNNNNYKDFTRKVDDLYSYYQDIYKKYTLNNFGTIYTEFSRTSKQLNDIKQRKFAIVNQKSYIHNSFDKKEDLIRIPLTDDVRLRIDEKGKLTFLNLEDIENLDLSKQLQDLGLPNIQGQNITQLSSGVFDTLFGIATERNNKRATDINTIIEEAKFTPVLYRVKLNLTNPRIHNWRNDVWVEEDASDQVTAAYNARKNGIDGVIQQNIIDPFLDNHYLVFEPSQILILGSTLDQQGFQNFVQQQTPQTYSEASGAPTGSVTEQGATGVQDTPTEMPTEAPESPQRQAEQAFELTPPEPGKPKRKIGKKRIKAKKVAPGQLPLVSDETLKFALNNAGWATKGGQLIRDMEGEAVSKTKWETKASTSQIDWWRNYKDEVPNSLTEKQAKDVLERAIAGQSITRTKERELIQFIYDTFKEFDQVNQEWIESQQDMEAESPEVQTWWESYKDILEEAEGLDFSEIDDWDFYKLVNKISALMNQEIPKELTDDRIIRGILDRAMEEVAKRKSEATTLTKHLNHLDELSTIQRKC